MKIKDLMKSTDLDEMQEKKLLKIEHNTRILVNIGLFAAIFIQTAILHDDRMAFGELAIFFVSTLYFTISCIKNGIWEGAGKRKEPNVERDIYIILIFSICFAIYWGASSYVKYHKPVGSLATACFVFYMTFIPFTFFEYVIALICKKRGKKLEKLADRDEEENIGEE